MEESVHVGSQGGYRWLTSSQESMNTVLRLCLEAVLGKYIAVTTYDSGELRLSAEDRKTGWQIRNGIAYSPQIRTAADLPDCARIEPAELYQEWYVFPEPAELGKLFQENVFITPPGPGEAVAFVNWPGFVVHDPDVQDLTALFWQQMHALKPESYFGEGEAVFTFVTLDPVLFERVLEIVKAAG